MRHRLLADKDSTYFVEALCDFFILNDLNIHP